MNKRGNNKCGRGRIHMEEGLKNKRGNNKCGRGRINMEKD